MLKPASSAAALVLLALWALPASAGSDPAKAFGDGSPRTVLKESSEFDRNVLMSPDYRSVSGLSFSHPDRFSMRQSYSMSYSASSFGSHSAGLYLNTVSYKLAEPLTLSADVGFYTPFYSSIPGMRQSLRDAGTGSSVIFPHVGLEYKPSKNSSVSLHLFNGPDAAKAYGHGGYLYPWVR